MKLHLVLLTGVVALVSSQRSVEVSRIHEEITVNAGAGEDIGCRTTDPINGCVFTTPYNDTLFLFPGSRTENGRISRPTTDSPNDCTIRISRVEDKDNGIWKCILSVPPAEDGDGDTTTGEAKINMIVAVAPTEVTLRVDGTESFNDAISLRLDDENADTMDISCVAKQTRPKPKFHWYIGDEITGVTAESQEEVQPNGLANYVNTLKYLPEAKHNGQKIRCEVEHDAYSEAQLDQEVNSVEREIELKFKPQEKAKETVFYKKEGVQEEIEIKFEANPEPSEGEWHMAGSDEPIAIGAQSIDGQYSSGFISPKENTGEYSATLTIRELKPEMAGKVNRLVVRNTEGETEYPFKIELGEKPQADGIMTNPNLSGNGAEPLGSGPVIGIVVIVIIVLVLVAIAVIARSKGALCFAASTREGGEPLQEEKDANFDVEKGGEQPLNPKPAGGDQNNEKSATKTPEKVAPKAEPEDEKKSGSEQQPQA